MWKCANELVDFKIIIMNALTSHLNSPPPPLKEWTYIASHLWFVKFNRRTFV